MSDTHLPEDFAQWPKDPHELLQVPERVDRRALRGAYTKLIRQFKPEHFPDHFQALRQAYEQLLQIVAWREKFERADDRESSATKDSTPTMLMPEVVPDAPLDQAAADDAATFGRDDQPAAPLRPRIVPLAEELDQLWQQSCDGDEAGAYRRLVELEQHFPGNADICIRLYWLLVVAPEVQPGRSPRDWLVTGLAASQLRGPLLELYRRELLRHPIEAASDRCRNLLNTTDDAQRLSRLADLRWTAAGKMMRYELIVKDVDDLRPRIVMQAEELWGRLLLSACDQLAWSDEPRYRAKLTELCQEVESLHPVLTSLRQQLERLDLLMALSEGWLKHAPKSTLSAQLHFIMPLTWNGTREELQRALTPLVAALLLQPSDALAVFDEVWSVSRPMLAHFGDCLPALQHPEDDANGPVDPREINEVRALAVTLVQQFRDKPYQHFRRIMLRFCLREMLGPEKVAAAISGQPHMSIPGAPDLAEALMGDLPLRILCHMHRIYWS